MRDLKPIEARARAFQGMFKVKPGQRVAVYANTPEVEREIMKWIAEVGHRHLKNVKVSDNGASYLSIELIKQEARR
jgi:TusA-related sulfurtransferase